MQLMRSRYGIPTKKGIDSVIYMGKVKEETKPVENIFKIITERIIGLLEKGVVPWQKPWKSSSFPINLFTQKEYRGINVFLLNMAGYSSPYWLTMRQAEKLGGWIRPDEQGTEIVFWVCLEIKMKAVMM